MSGRGSHTRVAPAGFSTSTLVVTSNVRQPAASAAASTRAARGSDRAAVAAPAVWRKCRRFMGSPREGGFHAPRASLPEKRPPAGAWPLLLADGFYRLRLR